MDKLPGKFRRKPRPPAIETAIETAIDSGASSDTAESTISIDTSKPDDDQSQHRKHAFKPIKKSPFRNLKLSRSAKRARGSPPSELPSSPPLPAVVSQDGVVSHTSAQSPVEPDMGRNGNGVGNGSENGTGGGGDQPRIPSFLKLSMQEIKYKFQEITWAERVRYAASTRNNAVEGFKWEFPRQADPEKYGIMDRYGNIKPWNHNRVKLLVPDEELDYVNASNVTLPSSPDESLSPLHYIAMQGPTIPSISYVWRMISEQTTSSSVIVQLTSMVERGAIKCHRYFPDDEESPTWHLNEGNVWNDGWSAKLTYDSLEELAGGAIEKRKLLLQVEGEDDARVIWHFLYKRWPDFGVPALDDLDSFFELMRLSREHSVAAGPRIVHCSAGIGRTGTFICLEYLMRELESGALAGYGASDEHEDLVFDAVDALREQRFGMVQSDVQFHFIYKVMRKLWQDKYGIEEDEADSGEPVAKRLEVADPMRVESLSEDEIESEPEI